MDQPGYHILLRGNSGSAADRMRELLALLRPQGHPAAAREGTRI